MTKEETIIQKELLRSYLEQAAGDTDMTELAKTFTDEFVIMVPDEKMQGLVVLGTKTASFKLGNICFDLKRAAITTAEWAATSAKPDSLENIFRLIITTAIWISRITKAEVNDVEASLLEWMHDNNMYDRLEEEEKVISQFTEYYRAKHSRTIELCKIEDAIKHLYAIKCIDIVNGKINLSERVWGRR